jgi:hypothetical protein
MIPIGTCDICDDGDMYVVEQGGKSCFRKFGWDMGHLRHARLLLKREERSGQRKAREQRGLPVLSLVQNQHTFLGKGKEAGAPITCPPDRIPRAPAGGCAPCTPIPDSLSCFCTSIRRSRRAVKELSNLSEL